MCLDMCRSEYAKAYIGCDWGMTMIPTVRDLCISGIRRRALASRAVQQLKKLDISFPVPLTGRSVSPPSKLFLHQSTSPETRLIMKIVTDDEEIDDACTRTDNRHVDFDEKIQEETDGTIEILKEKDAAEYV
ncbi:hypothetical protein AVEN_202883-1 [Araneus ventricosus]|uniref:Uncharacterized protein n=1 Tax=Araneus ventricosus TaxID=182803 RepID=A0A4Y2FI90_ARAVE|nr:hypothetical protein AVEN_202883-1 [Araneus ventricosus]